MTKGMVIKSLATANRADNNAVLVVMIKPEEKDCGMKRNAAISGAEVEAAVTAYVEDISNALVKGLFESKEDVFALRDRAKTLQAPHHTSAGQQAEQIIQKSLLENLARQDVFKFLERRKNEALVHE